MSNASQNNDLVRRPSRGQGELVSTKRDGDISPKTPQRPDKGILPKTKPSQPIDKPGRLDD